MYIKAGWIDFDDGLELDDFEKSQISNLLNIIVFEVIDEDDMTPFVLMTVFQIKKLKSVCSCILVIAVK